MTAVEEREGDQERLCPMCRGRGQVDSLLGSDIVCPICDGTGTTS